MNVAGFGVSLGKITEALTKPKFHEGLAWLLAEEQARIRKEDPDWTTSEIIAVFGYLTLKFQHAWDDKLRQRYPDQMFSLHLQHASLIENFNESVAYLCDKELERCKDYYVLTNKDPDQAMAFLLTTLIDRRVRAGTSLQLS